MSCAHMNPNDSCASCARDTLVPRLKKRAEIRRSITTRKSVQEGAPDRIAGLLEEAAARLELLERHLVVLGKVALGDRVEHIALQYACGEAARLAEKAGRGDV